MLDDLLPPNPRPLPPEAEAIRKAAKVAMNRPEVTPDPLNVRLPVGGTEVLCQTDFDAGNVIQGLRKAVKDAKIAAQNGKAAHRDARIMLGMALQRLRDRCRKTLVRYSTILTAVGLEPGSAENARRLLELCDASGKLDPAKVKNARAKRRAWIDGGTLEAKKAAKLAKSPALTSSLDAMTERQMLELVRDPKNLKRKVQYNANYHNAIRKYEAGRSAQTPYTLGGYPRELADRAGAGAVVVGAVVGAGAADPAGVLPAGDHTPAAVACVAVLLGNTSPVPAANAAPAGDFPVVGPVFGLTMPKVEARVQPVIITSDEPMAAVGFADFVARSQAAAVKASKPAGAAEPAGKAEQLTFDLDYAAALSDRDLLVRVLSVDSVRLMDCRAEMQALCAKMEGR